MRNQVVLALLIFSLLCGNVFALLSPPSEDNREASTLSVDGQYIATFFDPNGSGEPCEKASKIIRAWKKVNEATTYAANDEEMGVSAVAINATCTLFFEAIDEELVQYVTSEMPEVLNIEKNGIVRFAGSPASWGLDRIDQTDLPLSNTDYFSSYSGAGVNVFVIDTGLYTEHSDFEGRATLLKDFTSENGSDILDGNGHGTHCSGTVGSKTYGVAKQANIFGLKVLTSDGTGTYSSLIQALAYVVEYQDTYHDGESAVISMSLGGGYSYSLNLATSDASDAGMIVVVAAGNEADDACQYSPAGAGGDGDEGSVITVGSTHWTDQLSSFSNYGDCVDILAPGSYIDSTYIGSTSSSATLSGTSMATPHVAGAAAVLLEKHSFNKLAAQSELFSLASINKITGLSGAKIETPNLLLQVPQTTWAPTTPTVLPTYAPTEPQDSVCAVLNGTTSCVNFMQSEFGEDDFPDHQVMREPMYAVDHDMCDQTDEDLSGFIVIIPRGNCQFYDKVYNAQLQGAEAVILYMSTYDPIFAPISNYKRDKVEILSVMISKSDGENFILLALQGAMGQFGSPAYSESTAFPTPYPTTRAPTSRPSRAPTQHPTPFVCSSLNSSKKRCGRAKSCIYDRSSETCYEWADVDTPCNILSKKLCNKNSACYWGTMPLSTDGRRKKRTRKTCLAYLENNTM